MTAVTAAATAGSQLSWFVSRGSGLVLLVALSAVLTLGVAVRVRSQPPRLTRFMVAELHRTLSLFAVALLGLHVTTALVDPYVSIGWLATVVPFVSHFKTAAVGLGALGVDLVGAVLVTSLLRDRLGFRAWRGLHWLGYVAWPVAVLHAFSAGPDLHLWWAATLEWGSVAAVATAVVTRAFAALRPPTLRAPSGHRRGRVAA